MPSGEIVNYLLRHYSDILSMIIDQTEHLIKLLQLHVIELLGNGNRFIFDSQIIFTYFLLQKNKVL